MKSTEHAKILIVEDEGIIADNLALRLSTAGYEVTGIADSAGDVIEKIRERVPELILMNISIKGSMDGIETTAALRELSDIPVIYLTAYSDQKTIDRAKATGASGFLAKPIQYSALGNAIEMAISKHRSEGKTRYRAGEMCAVLDSIYQAASTLCADGKLHLANVAAGKVTEWEGDAPSAEQPFKAASTAKGAATPSGLAIVQKIVKDLGGTIHIESEQGRAPSLKISVPCASATKTTAPKYGSDEG